MITRRDLLAAVAALAPLTHAYAEARGRLPHITGEAFLAEFGLARGTPFAHALTDLDFADLARRFGLMGGADRMATVIKAIRAERPGRCLLLDGGDTWQGAWTNLQTKAADMVAVQKALGVEAMVGHWEFTYGADRVTELAKGLGFPFLAGNVQDREWNEDVFPDHAMFERGGVKIAVIGQALPYTPIANPAWMFPDWEFGIKEEKIAARVQAVREAGAALVVLLSHNGFEVDRKLAARVPGIDVILTGHTHDALPRPVQIGRTLLIATGASGKFISRLDLDVQGGRVAGYRHALIPVFSNTIAPDADMAALVRGLREPYAADLARVVGRTESLLWRRGNTAGTWDDVICNALLEQRDAEIALSPSFRWGTTLLPDTDITAEDVWAQTAITYPAAYRSVMRGAAIKALLEDIADNLFHPDPFYQQGGDMVRSGGISFTLDVAAASGQRISDVRLKRNGEAIEASRDYVVAGWASINQAVEGPPIWDLVFRHLAKGPLRVASRNDIALRSV